MVLGVGRLTSDLGRLRVTIVEWAAVLAPRREVHAA